MDVNLDLEWGLWPRAVILPSDAAAGTHDDSEWEHDGNSITARDDISFDYGDNALRFSISSAPHHAWWVAQGSVSRPIEWLVRTRIGDSNIRRHGILFDNRDGSRLSVSLDRWTGTTTFIRGMRIRRDDEVVHSQSGYLWSPSTYYWQRIRYEDDGTVRWRFWESGLEPGWMETWVDPSPINTAQVGLYGGVFTTRALDADWYSYATDGRSALGPWDTP